MHIHWLVSAQFKILHCTFSSINWRQVKKTNQPPFFAESRKRCDEAVRPKFDNQPLVCSQNFRIYSINPRQHQIVSPEFVIINSPVCFSSVYTVRFHLFLFFLFTCVYKSPAAPTVHHRCHQTPVFLG